LKKLLISLFSLIFIFVFCFASVFSFQPQTAFALTSGDYKYSVNSDTTATITDYTGSSSSVTIPSTLGGHTVTVIGGAAFNDCTLLKQLTIPNSVTTIQQTAFLRSALTSVTVGSGVSDIGFSMSSPLNAFFWCGALTQVTVNAANTHFSSLNGVLFNKAKTLLWCFPHQKTGSYSIPVSVTTIGYYAFGSCSKLTGVTIPDSVTSIQSDAFSFCTGLHSVSIPGTVSFICPDAFTGCTGLTSLTIGNGVETIAIGAFSSCSKLTSVIIPDTVTEIRDLAFEDCTSLTGITIPDSVNDIGNSAFGGCTALKTVSFEGDLYLYHFNYLAKAFSGCTSLTQINVDSENKYISSLDGVLYNKTQTSIYCYPKGRAGKYTIPNGVTVIGEYAFDGCAKLTGVTLPSGLLNIGMLAFQNCTGLTQIVFPSTLEYIDYGAFEGCTGLTAISIPSGVSNIPYYGKEFMNCTKLTSAYFYGASPVTSTTDAFSGCSPSLVIYCLDANKDGFKQEYYGYPIQTFTAESKIAQAKALLPAKFTAVEGRDVNLLDCLNAINGMGKTGMNLSIVSANPGVADNGNFTYATDPVTGDVTVHIKALNGAEDTKTISVSVGCYTVHFNSGGGTAVADIYADANTTITAPAVPTRTGHTFDKWYKEDTLTNEWNFATDLVTATRTLFAKWTANTYTVTFDYQNGTPGLESKDVVYGESYGELPASTRTNYMFGGWYTQANGAGTPITESSVVAITTDKIFYAKWTGDVHTVTFNPQGGSIGTATKTVNYGAAYGALPTPVKTGYNFSGWYTAQNGAGTLVNSSTTVNLMMDQILYAKWTLAAPSAPTNVKAASKSYTSIKISWSAVTSANGYEIWQLGSDGKYQLLTSTTATSYIHTGLTTGKTYSYKVKAYRNGSPKLYSAFSAIVSAFPAPAAPAAVKASPASYDKIKITWSKSTGATVYTLYRSANGGAFSLLKTTSSLTYTNTGVSTGTTYTYKVKAGRRVGSKTYFGEYSAVSTAKTILAVPGSFKVARASATSVKVTFGKVAGAAKYEIWRSLTNTNGFTCLTTITGTSYTNTGLVTGRRYYYKVRAYRLVNGKKVYSNYTAVKSATP
jgi:uncharacterized repeat protein (TIGR02543 family)